VITSDGPVEYDFLIVAAGARHSYFGRDEWEPFAPGLKTLDDALDIRRRMLMAFEIAEKTNDAAEREAAMTFVVVGGGPTGVEMAGAVAEIARVTLIKDFRHIDSSQARVFLIESGPEVLQAFSGDLPKSALKQLTGLGVDVRLNTKVEAISEAGVSLTGGEKISAKTVVWAAGNSASPLGASLGVPLDRQGRVIVCEDCSIPGRGEVFVIGDQAHFATGEGRPLPGLSPVAMQQGRHVAKNIVALLRGGSTSRFTYRDKGIMATIGRHAAVAEMGSLRMSGFLAWLAWLFIHIIFLVGFRNRLSVLFNWAYAYVTYGRGARLITHRQACGDKPGDVQRR
jgi:NADH dehydrogenase